MPLLNEDIEAIAVSTALADELPNVVNKRLGFER